MKVYFIGAGPGAADLITLRGAQILARTPMVLYAGSLVSRDMLAHCRADAEIFDTAALNLDEQEAHYVRARDRSWDVARLHTGDPSIYGATAEQMRRLEKLGIDYEVVPGVSSFTAAASVLNAELTKPEVSQTVILTRTSGRTPMPDKESLKSLAAHQATLCIFLSGANLPQAAADLLTAYPPETTVALVQKATWPQQKIHRSTLGGLLAGIDVNEWKLSTMLIVGNVLNDNLGVESQLYSGGFSHLFRKAGGNAPE